MKKINYKIFIFYFFCFFIPIILAEKYTGYIDRFSTAYHEPISWNEIYLGIPRLIIFSLIVGLVMTLFHNEAKKTEDKNIENARKRIEERERLEKEQKEKKSKPCDQLK